MFDRFRHAREEVEDLNLIPIMNLMMTLIPFLLLGAAFYHIGVIPTSLPTHVPEGSKEPPKKEVVVTLNLQVEKDKMLLGASATGLSQEEQDALGGEFPNKDGRYDLKGLQAQIERIKSSYPKSDTVVVLPADDVKYQSLVDILDTTREKLTPREGDDPLREPLFPVTVFSKMLKPEPKDEGEGASR